MDYIQFKNLFFEYNGWSIVLFTVLLSGLFFLRMFLRRLTIIQSFQLFHLLVKNTRAVFIIFFSLFVSLQALHMNQNFEWYLNFICVIVFVFQLMVWGNSVVGFFVKRYKDKHLQSVSEITTIDFTAFVVKVVLFSILIVVGLHQLGIQVTTLIAGLGVGGIAIALAIQNILSDLFASLTILLDRPFQVGEFIIVDQFLGTVEKVGLKTTHIRSLSGELLVFPNSNLLQSRIRNYQYMKERRVVFNFGVLYETPYEKLKMISQTVKEIIESQEMTRFDRAHFQKFGESSLDFEVVYYILAPEYNVYMDKQEIINLELVRRFQNENISFAYPTRTLYIL